MHLQEFSSSFLSRLRGGLLALFGRQINPRFLSRLRGGLPNNDVGRPY